MEKLAKLPSDTVFFTQITMEAAEDPAFLDAMRRAHIKGALVGVEAVTPEGLKDVYKDFNYAGETLVERLRAFKQPACPCPRLVHLRLAERSPRDIRSDLDDCDPRGVTFAQFVMLTPFPGTVDFASWEKSMEQDPTRIGGIPLTRHWLIPQELRPKVYTPHPVMDADEIRQRTQARLGRLLQPVEDLGSIALRDIVEGAAGVRADLEAVPADVRQHRHRDRQRAREPLGALGARHRRALPSPVRRAAHARSRNAVVSRRDRREDDLAQRNAEFAEKNVAATVLLESMIRSLKEDGRRHVFSLRPPRLSA